MKYFTCIYDVSGYIYAFAYQGSKIKRERGTLKINQHQLKMTQLGKLILLGEILLQCWKKVSWTYYGPIEFRMESKEQTMIVLTVLEWYNYKILGADDKFVYFEVLSEAPHFPAVNPEN